MLPLILTGSVNLTFVSDVPSLLERAAKIRQSVAVSFLIEMNLVDFENLGRTHQGLQTTITVCLSLSVRLP